MPAYNDADRKAVEQTLNAAGTAVTANDVIRLLECISTSAERTRRDAQLALERVEVRWASIRDLEIKVNRLTSPWTAQASFLAIGNGRNREE